jgi:hypothetical protein
MRKLILVSSLALFIVLAFTTLAPNVYADGNPWVATFKEDGTPSDVFDIGEKVNITAYSASVPYDIIVKDSDGVTRYTDTSSTPRYSKIISGITDKLGWWEVTAGSAETYYASAWYKVIPEVPLGVVAVLTACFAGLGVKRLRVRRKETV